MTEQNSSSEGPAFAEGLLNSIFNVWVEPELKRRGLQLTRDEIVKVTIELDPLQPTPIIKLNEEAGIIASVRATRAIAAGEAVSEADFDEVHAVRPAEIGPDSGWACFAVIKGQAVIAFDFRYNRSQAQRLVQRAREFLSAAHYSAESAPGVACDTAFSAAELSVQAQMMLQHQITKSHWKRQDWLDGWTKLENAPSDHAVALGELHDNRAAARYADAELDIPVGRLSELLAIVEEMIDEADARSSDSF